MPPKLALSTLICSVVLLLSSMVSAADGAATAIPALPISFAVAEVDGAPVVSDVWLTQQVAEAERLLGAHAVHVEQVAQRPLPQQHTRLETAVDRDKLAARIDAKVINVFVVASLRDVDDPTKHRMGVRWRQRRNLANDYIILAASAMPTTLAHELGHYFGNGHSPVVNNIMSYQRDDPTKVAFNQRQGATMRRTARGLLRRRKLLPAREFEAAARRQREVPN